MMRNRVAIVLGSAMTLVATTPAIGQAPAPTAPAEADREEILVVGTRFFRPVLSSSAAKMDLPIAETPQSVSEITADILETFQVFNLRDISKFSAGIDARAEQIGERSDLKARGFDVDLFDGFKLNGISFIPVQPIDPVLLDRIEILKGPSGVIYGRNSYGGAVNYITKRPAAKPEAQLAVTGGQLDFWRAETDISRPIGEALAFRLPAAYQRNDSSVDRDSRLLTLAPSLSWRPAQGLELFGIGVYQNWKTQRSVGLGAVARNLPTTIDNPETFFFIGCTPDQPVREPVDEEDDVPLFQPDCGAPPSFVRKAFLAPRSFGSDYRAETLQLVSQLNYEFAPRHRLFLNATYLWSDFEAVQAYLGSIIAADGTVQVWDDRVAYVQKGWSTEIGATGTFELFGRDQQYYVGADYRFFRRDREEHNDKFMAQVNVFDIGRGLLTYEQALARAGVTSITTPPDNLEVDRREFAGLGAQLLLNLPANLSLLVGGRLERNRLTLDQTPITEEGDDADSRIEGTEFLPRLGVTWHFVPDRWNVYASYTRGYVPQAGFQIDRSTGAVSPIDPETGSQVEVGIKGLMFENRLLTTLAAFRIKRRGVAINDPDNQPGEDFVIGGLSQTNQGLEFEAIGEPLKGLNLAAAIAYIDAQFDDTGDEPAAVPRYKLSLFANYDVASGPLAGFSFGGGARHVGRQVGLVGSTYRIDPYTTVDLRLGYQVNDRVRLNLTVDNLFDEAYYLPIGDLDFCCGSFGDPRTVRLTASVRL